MVGKRSICFVRHGECYLTLECCWSFHFSLPGLDPFQCDPETDPDTNPETDPDTDPEMDPDTDPETDPDTEMDPDTNP